MDQFNKSYYYTKGIYEANYYSLSTRDLVYHDAKLLDSNIESSVNITEVVAGMGNSTQIMLFDSGKFNITMTAADIDLRQYQLQTGGTMGYNGVAETCEIITANSAALTLTNTPCADYGTDQVVCYVNSGGTAYTVNPTTKVVQGFTATSGTQYSVRYFVQAAANQELDVKSLFTPEIVSCRIKFPIYKAAAGTSAATGSHCADLWVIIPRYQFNGSASLSASQTDAVKPALSGQAIAYDNPVANGCESALSSLLYMVWVPVDQAEGITDMVVAGGGEVSVVAGGTVAIPVKFVMKDGYLAQPDLSDLTYETSASGTATVSNGVVTGVAAGDCTITITNTSPALSCVCSVEVTA